MPSVPQLIHCHDSGFFFIQRGAEICKKMNTQEFPTFILDLIHSQKSAAQGL